MYYQQPTTEKTTRRRKHLNGYHLDFKIHDRLSIREASLELKLLEINEDGSVLVEVLERYDTQLRILQKERNYLGNDIVIYNFGKRHIKSGNHKGGYHGRRIHIALTIPSIFSFVHYKQREYALSR